MLAPITFLSAASSVRLAKVIGEKVQPYPLVREVNSFEFATEKTQEGLKQRIELYREKARYGYAVQRGKLRKVLENESRRGQTEREALNHTLLIDVDNWHTPIDLSSPTQETLQAVAEEFVAILPPALRDVSYIAHASSSFGMKKGKAGMHLEFVLDVPLSPVAIKDWLKHLNLTLPEIEKSIALTPSGHTLAWIIDPSLADNSKIVYIAPPTFTDGVQNPFTSDDDRFVLVEKTRASVDLIEEVGSVQLSELNSKINSKVKTLRKAIGLKGGTPRTRGRSSGGFTQQVISSPDAMRLDLYDINDEFAVFNVNGGDSHAYWCRLNDPDLIMNFKGEPPFLFSRADPEGYEAFITRYSKKLVAANPVTTLVFREPVEDKFYVASYDQINDKIIRNPRGCLDMNRISVSNIEQEMNNRGAVAPDPIPSYYMTFDPKADYVFDKANKTINCFSPPELFVRVPAIDDSFKNCSYELNGENEGYALLRILTPNIAKLIHHIAGNNLVCVNHFINWLAFVYQFREVSSTTWMFSGTQGTGKNLFFEKVLRPIWTDQYTSMKELRNLADQFDGGMDRQLLICVDEVHAAQQGGSALIDRLKHMIGREVGTVRAMQTEQRTASFFYNFIMFSNHLDAMVIEHGDRRFNVCPPQMLKLNQVHPSLIDDLSWAEDEVPLFASFLYHFNVNRKAARIALENEAKERMKAASMTSTQVFFDVLKRDPADLDFFIENLMFRVPNVHNLDEKLRHDAGMKIVSRWIEDVLQAYESDVSVDDLRTLYLAIFTDSNITAIKFGQMLAKNQLVKSRPRNRVTNERYYGFKLTFGSTEYDTDSLTSMLKANTAVERKMFAVK